MNFAFPYDSNFKAVSVALRPASSLSKNNTTSSNDSTYSKLAARHFSVRSAPGIPITGHELPNA